MDNLPEWELLPYSFVSQLTAGPDYVWDPDFGWLPCCSVECLPFTIARWWPEDLSSL